MTLHNLGVEGVHPLRGGYDEWKKLGFPLAPATTTSPIVKSLQVVYAAISTATPISRSLLLRSRE